MKAKYILDAVAAMKNAERMLHKYPDTNNSQENYRVGDALMDARCALYAYSGIHDVDIEIEKKEAA